MAYITADPHVTTSSHCRGDLPVPAATIFCEPCQKNGHFCPASNVIEGETPKCIFCEDNEPCPHARQKPAASSIQPMLQHDVVGKVAIQARRRTQQEFKQKRAATAQQPVVAEREVPPSTANPPLGRDGLTRRSTRPSPTQSTDTPCKEGTMDEQKICGRPGCGKKLTPANRSGFCAAHFYDSKRKSGNAIAGGRRMSRETKPAKRETKHPAGETHRAITENTAASLLVSEAQINRMFLNWPLEDKVLAVQAFLDREG